ncbi:FKBP-type peptidyl-prolyl cis-trans isomerase [Sulfuracidifex tepidarius]|uniref:Peptidyl-prolyl cis-trans isomerase n=1 Tax=Sulfuracidifex tepidarius TaxID=1294262 RepID=A0A510E3V1_9CREN|nr:peptidylprolyl isomerase [Sulfuracidifex tepidarius]BBG24437.1 Putative FKBP-type peptidyl-prolyl cis-trans isomerase [Sulfuracidifex tepidarius]BBG27195.1 Putative FKBP-type peptidyl-prolyl cis-trans isomerase [Sulfuracidifex tepidarius]
MFKDKDFLLIDYTEKVKDSGEVIDTTNEEEAKKEGIYREDKTYGPTLIILGQGDVVKGLEEALYNAEVGAEKTIEVPPEKAYGTRDPTKIKIVSLSELKRQGINPYPNMVLRLNEGGLATVKSVSGGRVILDLNHPLADKTIIYNFKVEKLIESQEDKVKAILGKWFKKSGEKIGVDMSTEKKVKLTMPKELLLVENIQLLKYVAAKDIVKFVLPEHAVLYEEEFDSSILK